MSRLVVALGSYSLELSWLRSLLEGEICYVAAQSWFLLITYLARNLSPITLGKVKLWIEGGMAIPTVSIARNDYLTTISFYGDRGTYLPITLICYVRPCLAFIYGFSGIGVKFTSWRFNFIIVDIPFSEGKRLCRSLIIGLRF